MISALYLRILTSFISEFWLYISQFRFIFFYLRISTFYLRILTFYLMIMTYHRAFFTGGNGLPYVHNMHGLDWHTAQRSSFAFLFVAFALLKLSTLCFTCSQNTDVLAKLSNASCNQSGFLQMLKQKKECQNFCFWAYGDKDSPLFWISWCRCARQSRLNAIRNTLVCSSAWYSKW